MITVIIMREPGTTELHDLLKTSVNSNTGDYRLAILLIIPYTPITVY